jgi:hypothetical protein
MVTIEDLVQELERETDATRRTLARIPEDKLDWRPHPKSMTLGQLGCTSRRFPARSPNCRSFRRSRLGRRSRVPPPRAPPSWSRR